MSGATDNRHYRKAFRVAVFFNFLLLATVAALWWNSHEKKTAAAGPDGNTAESATGTGSLGGSAPETMNEAPLAPVQLPPERMQSIGAKLETVRSRLVSSEIRAAGNVEINERQVAYVQTRVPGWLRQVFADATYQYVQKGQPLYSIYSPDVVNTEQDYVLAEKSLEAARGSTVPGVEGGAQSLLAAAILRLTQWDVPPSEIQRLSKTRHVVNDLIVNSPAAGYITERNALVNAYVQPETRLYTIADLSTVWVYAQVFQTDLGKIKPGDPVLVTVDAYPGRAFRGQVDSILPQVDTTTRTARVRIVFPNPDLKLTPGMFVNAVMKNPLGRQTVAPASAIFQSGARQLVFVSDGKGQLTPREVQTGAQVTLPPLPGASSNGAADGDAMVVITKGLKPGESIAASANFLIDSESQLQAAAGAFTPPAADPEKASSSPQANLEFMSDPSPPRKGANLFHVKLTGKDGAPLAGAQVTATLYMAAMPEMGMAAMKTTANCTERGGGIYEAQGDLGSGGTWQVTLTAQKNGRVIASKKFAVNATGGM